MILDFKNTWKIDFRFMRGNKIERGSTTKRSQTKLSTTNGCRQNVHNETFTTINPIIISYYLEELPRRLNWHNGMSNHTCGKIANWVTTGGDLVQFSFVKSGDMIVSTTRLNSTRPAEKCSELAKLTRTIWNQLSSVELSRKNDQSARSDSTRLVEFSWVGLDRALWTRL